MQAVVRASPRLGVAHGDAAAAAPSSLYGVGGWVEGAKPPQPLCSASRWRPWPVSTRCWTSWASPSWRGRRTRSRCGGCAGAGGRRAAGTWCRGTERDAAFRKIDCFPLKKTKIKKKNNDGEREGGDSPEATTFRRRIEGVLHAAIKGL